VPYLTITGRGAPGSGEFEAKVGALYALAYGVKALMKRDGKDFSIPKLEGLWWVESDKAAWETPREEWCWKLLIRMPEFVTEEVVERAKAHVIKKRGEKLVNEVRLERIDEGECVQILHVGPYSAEPESLEKMKRFMEEKGLIPHGFHHEIYLTDPRRTAKERLKTILRQPVKRVDR